MILTGVIRLGKDAELRFTADGQPVANVSGAWNYGQKGEDGNRKSQWIKLTLWGNRAESLEQYLKKGREFLIVATDVHVETYEKNGGGEGFNLVGKISEIEFTAGSSERQDGGRGRENEAAAQQRNRGGDGRQRAPAPQQRRTHGDRPGGPNNRQGYGSSGGWDDMPDDAPF